MKNVSAIMALFSEVFPRKFHHPTPQWECEAGDRYWHHPPEIALCVCGCVRFAKSKEIQFYCTWHVVGGGVVSPQRQRKATWHWGTVGWKESKKINHGIQLGGFLPWLCFILYVVLRRNIWWNLSCHYGSSIWWTIFGSVFYSSDGLLDPSQNIVRCLDDELPPRFYDIRGFQEANKVLEICLQWNFNFYTSI